MIILQVNATTFRLNILDPSVLKSQEVKIISDLVKEATLELYAEIKQRIPVDHGRARSSLQIVIESSYKQSIVSGVEYMSDIDEGTGIFGKFNKPIVPVHAKVLHFYIGNQEVFTKSVKGQEGKHFTRDGIKAVEMKLDAIAMRVLSNY